MPAKGNRNYTDVSGAVSFKTDAKGRQSVPVFQDMHRKHTVSSSKTVWSL